MRGTLLTARAFTLAQVNGEISATANVVSALPTCRNVRFVGASRAEAGAEPNNWSGPQLSQPRLQLVSAKRGEDRRCFSSVAPRLGEREYMPASCVVAAGYGSKLLQTVIASERERLFELYVENCVPLAI